MKGYKIMKTQRMIKTLFSACALLVAFSSSCNLLDPELDNVYGEKRAWGHPQTAYGFLNTAYLALPTTYSFSECATDDAVMNDVNSFYPRLVSGAWSDIYDPLEPWSQSYRAIMNINHFMTFLPDITISWSNAKTDSLYRIRWKGEAYGMRAYHHLTLLMYYGGKGVSGEYLGIPYLDKMLTADQADWKNLVRLPFLETVQKIAQDLDTAIACLPLDYSGSDDPLAGFKNRGRFSKRIAYGAKARLYMHAASPLYNAGNYNVALCDSAVKYAVLAIGTRTLGSLYGNQLFYRSDLPSSSEIIWRQNMLEPATTEEMMQQTIEAQNYPPSLKGLGRVNPTQDFVDAFPAANGYPITHPLSGYNPEEPYLNRDPRLDSIVIRDGGVFAGKKIHTYKDSSEDGIESSGATRTGYYLKKLLRQDVSIVDPVMGKKNCRPLMRTTEMYLIFAEAQTASKGPDAEIEVAFSPQSPRSVVKRIRRRSGIPKADPYASTVGQEEFMDLLRNERRIELAFEGFRFLDLRRWQMEVNGTVKRIRILPGKTPEILPITEEPRNYTRFKYFAPLPQAELQKCKLLEQNASN